MKTTLPFLLLLFLAACSSKPPPYETWKPQNGNGNGATTVRPPTEKAATPVGTASGMPEVPQAVAGTQRMTITTTSASGAQPSVVSGSPEAAGTAPVVPAATPAVPVAVPGTPGVGLGIPPTAPAPGALGPGAPAGTPGTPGPGEAPVTTAADAPPEELLPAGMIAFQNTPLDQVLDIYSKFVNRTLLRPQTLNAQQQITLKTQTALTRSEIKQALDAILALNGITMIDVGEKFVKVVPQAQAPTEGARPDTRDAAQMNEMGQFVTHVIQLKYVKPSEIMPALQPFAKMNSIVPIETSQIIVLRDYTENVKRMLEMIQRIDVLVPSDFISEVIFIRYAKATDIADALNSLSGGSTGGTVGRQPATPSNRPTTAIPGRQGGPGGGVPTGRPATRRSEPARHNGWRGWRGGGSFTDRLSQLVRRAATSGDLQILGQTKMIADERSNSLLIFASRADMEMIKNIVGKLDVVLAQVLIETVIMDVTLDDTWALGVSAAQSPHNINGNTRGAGGYNNAQQFFNWLSGVTSNSFPGNQTSVLPPGFSYFAQINQEWDIAIQAAAADSRVNVIQKPRILTTHAKEAFVFIGNTVPYVTGTYYNGGYGGGPSSQYQQLSVGISLSVIPFINPDGLVVMELEEAIDEISGSTAITGVGNVPNTTSRKFVAEVAVKDGDSVILGGFIRNSTDKQVSGVPLLKDIPLLGALFSSRSSTKSRKELIVMMRPTVLRTPEIAALATVEEKKRLPGVSAAEAENNAQEKKLTDRERQRANRENPFSHDVPPPPPAEVPAQPPPQ